MDKQYDARMQAIPSLKWLPWVGDEYAASDARLLVLGDSHYALDDEDNETATHDKDFMRGIVNCFIEKRLEGKRSWIFFDGLMNTLWAVPKPM